MSDWKSKIPDIKELGEMTGKLFKDIKKSVDEIVSSYKQKRPASPESSKPKEAKKEAPAKKESAEVKEEKKADEKK